MNLFSSLCRLLDSYAWESSLLLKVHLTLYLAIRPGKKPTTSLYSFSRIMHSFCYGPILWDDTLVTQRRPLLYFNIKNQNTCSHFLSNEWKKRQFWLVSHGCYQDHRLNEAQMLDIRELLTSWMFCLGRRVEGHFQSTFSHCFIESFIWFVLFP